MGYGKILHDQVAAYPKSAALVKCEVVGQLIYAIISFCYQLKWGRFSTFIILYGFLCFQRFAHTVFLIYNVASDTYLCKECPLLILSVVMHNAS